MPVKIASFEIENIKRVKALSLEPAPDGLTIVGGKNEQGKTSVLDAIAWTLGGDRFRPSEPQREGSVTPPKLQVTLSNGLVVERKGASSALKVIDPRGNKGGQQLLNEFIEALALDLPRFMQSTSKEKAKTLLQVIGVGDKLYELEDAEARLYNRRREIGQIAEQKKGAAEEMPWHPDAPTEAVSAMDLVNQNAEILARNGENQKLREQVDQIERDREAVTAIIDGIDREIAVLKEKRAERAAQLSSLIDSHMTARKTAEQLADESTAEIEASIAAIDETNAKVRANQARSLIDDEVIAYTGQYEEMSAQIEAIRAEKLALLEGADLPLPGLSVEAGELVYNGFPWDGLSGSEQLKVATAIVRRLNPECGFVLLDKLEQMDLDTLREFGAWLTSEGLQVIATRVSTGDECSVVIEDGYAVDPEKPAGWKAGEF